MKSIRRIADYRWRYILYASVCAAILIFGMSKNGVSSHSWQFWLGQLFLVIALCWLLILIFSNKNKFVGRTGYLFNQELGEEVKDIYSGNSYFSFNENGFVFSAPTESVFEVHWKDILKVHAWVEDQIVVDDMICIRIDLKNHRFLEFDEITPGFLQFVSHCNTALNCFSSSWIEELNLKKRRELQLFVR
jgi:hypothetical protein